MLYTSIRAIAGVALHWFYRDVEIHGVERIPRDQPLLLVVNHPNALVDALIVMRIVPRRVLITAKATLFENPIGAKLLSWFGVLPLRRSSDARAQPDDADPERNRATFRMVNEAFRRRRAILIFPEGKSHDEPFLAPLKTGAARMALEARDSGAAPDLVIVPVGLTFERKEAPRSRVLVQVGTPIAMNTWENRTDLTAAEALTAEITSRLRAVTLNFASTDDASRAAALASVIAALVSEPATLGRHDRPLSVDAGIARRVDALSAELASARPVVRERADRLARRLDAFRRASLAHGIVLEDVGISLRWRDGFRFLAREGRILLFAGPLAMWGWVNHWIPFHTARLIAARSIDSAADPAMRTIVAGTALVLAAYVVQGIVVGLLAGPWVAAAYVASLPLAAEINFIVGARRARAWHRARAFIVLRRHPEVRAGLVTELESLRNETLALDTELRSDADPVAR